MPYSNCILSKGKRGLSVLREAQNEDGIYSNDVLVDLFRMNSPLPPPPPPSLSLLSLPLSPSPCLSKPVYTLLRQPTSGFKITRFSFSV